MRKLSRVSVRVAVALAIAASTHQALAAASGSLYVSYGGGGVLQGNLDGTDMVNLASLQGYSDYGAMAIDNLHGKMYLARTDTAEVYCANLDGSNITGITPHNDGMTCAGVAVDPQAGYVYWSVYNGIDATGEIQRASLAGSGMATLVSGLPAVGGIALDDAVGKMYWVDWSREALDEANLDGSDVQTLETGIDVNSASNAVAIDTVNGHLYWTESLNGIWEANLDGTGAHQIIPYPTVEYPCDIALDVPDGKLYFSQNQPSYGVWEANLDGTDLEELPINFTPEQAPCGLAVYLAPVPEPSTFALLVLSAASLIAFAWRRRSSRKIVACLLVFALSLAANLAHAQSVFNMPNGEASLQFVTVGNPGNVADYTGFGSVGYTYQMGQYDVTVGQYCQFLNAVAATDTYGLYNSYMAMNSSGTPWATQSMPTVGIVRSGSSGSYTYSVSYNSVTWSSYVSYNSSLYPSALDAAADCPIFNESWGDSARFCNWLQNGQPTNLGEAAGSTEEGAYTLDGATSVSALMAINRNTNATYFIPTKDEWYKAAYYNPSTATYWTYPTQSNSEPSTALSTTGTNNANYTGPTDPTNYLTPVGAFASSPGPYGTYDMGGDVFQWTEAKYINYRILRGGSWNDAYLWMMPSSDNDDKCNPVSSLNIFGFRVASVPEPGSIALLICGAIAVLIWCRRRR